MVDALRGVQQEVVPDLAPRADDLCRDTVDRGREQLDGHSLVVVPLVEEIFWRGFLLRYLINERFTTVAIGSFSWLSFAVVTVLFGFSHSRADWVAAVICGALYNLVAYRTRSLASCVVAHAVTNCLLGLWVMQTRQWGFW